jgi:hypothetical protein
LTTIQKSRLPAPAQLILKPLNEMELAELIEKHVEFVQLLPDGSERTVRLQANYVKHFLTRDDAEEGLPIVSSISQLPIVLPNGEILSGWGLNRKYGIIFRVPAELDALIPSRADCTAEAVGKAMQFLCDEWLCDVATDYNGKCMIIAAVLMILERALLPMRPVVFVTAGHRGGGKTMTLQMLIMAACGLPAAGAAWSNDLEERRKALFTYLDLGLQYIIWDNIAQGTSISCPAIERACTLEFYTDRVLGSSTSRTVATYTILFFTGNNIAPRGNLVSRSLVIRLSVDRVDPENRSFQHPDPVEWTNDHRGQILASLYTILLGNPRRSQRKSERGQGATRFRVWYDMIGSAVEFASKQHVALLTRDGPADAPEPRPETVDFKKLFLDSEDDEEQSSSLASVLDVLHRKFSKPDSLFQASDVVSTIFPSGAYNFGGISFSGEQESQAAAFKAALEIACGNKSIPIISAPVINWRLKGIKDWPTKVEGKILVLRYQPPDRDGRNGGFKVEELKTMEDV